MENIKKDVEKGKRLRDDEVKYVLGDLGVGIIFKSSLRPGVFQNCKLNM